MLWITHSQNIVHEIVAVDWPERPAIADERLHSVPVVAIKSHCTSARDPR